MTFILQPTIVCDACGERYTAAAPWLVRSQARDAGWDVPPAESQRRRVWDLCPACRPAQQLSLVEGER